MAWCIRQVSERKPLTVGQRLYLVAGCTVLIGGMVAGVVVIIGAWC